MRTTRQSRFVSIPKSDLESLVATVETLENEYVMKQIKRSVIDIKKGKVMNVRDFMK